MNLVQPLGGDVMGNKNNYKAGEEIKDAMWKNAESGKDMFGEIKFRKNNKKNYFKSFLKVFSFILIASLSGGITAQYVINSDKAPKDVSGALNSNALGSNQGYLKILFQRLLKRYHQQ